jgi:hypothetical protein
MRFVYLPSNINFSKHDRTCHHTLPLPAYLARFSRSIDTITENLSTYALKKSVPLLSDEIALRFAKFSVPTRRF